MDVLDVAEVSIDYALSGRKRRHQRHGAVRNVSFTIGEREFVTVVGPSGCGKTSLLRAVAGLVPISSGEIAMKERDGRAPFAMVFQQPTLLPWLTVQKNIEYGAKEWIKDTAELTAAADEALALVGLSDYRRYYPRQLSGGMQQRVNLARAIAVRPDLLLLDEPFSGLDPDLRERMQVELANIWGALGASAVFVSHQIDEAVFLADRVLVFTGLPGKLTADIRIDLPRPRDVGTRGCAEFAAYQDEIRSAVYADAAAADAGAPLSERGVSASAGKGGVAGPPSAQGRGRVVSP